MKKVIVAIFIITLVLVIYSLYEKRDYTKDAVEISNTINELLISRGVVDGDIISQHVKEIKRKNSQWFEFYKQLRVKFSQEWYSDLKSIAEKYGCVVEKKEVERDSISVAIVRNSKRFVTIHFTTTSSKKAS